MIPNPTRATDAFSYAVVNNQSQTKKVIQDVTSIIQVRHDNHMIQSLIFRLGINYYFVSTIFRFG